MPSVPICYVARHWSSGLSLNPVFINTIIFLGLMITQGGCLDPRRDHDPGNAKTLNAPAPEGRVSVTSTSAPEAPSEWAYVPPKDSTKFVVSDEALAADFVREVSRVSHHRTETMIMRFRELINLGDGTCPSFTREGEEDALTFIIEDFCETNSGVQFEGRLFYEETSEREDGFRANYISVYGDRFKVIYPDGSALALSGAREMSLEVSDDAETRSALSEGLFQYTPASNVATDSTPQSDEDHREPVTLSEWDQRGDPFELRHEISQDQEGMLTLSIEGSWRVSQSDESDEALTAITFDRLELGSDADCPLTIRGATDIRGRDGRWRTLMFGPHFQDEDSEGRGALEEVEDPERLGGDVDEDDVTTPTDPHRCDPCGQIITPDKEPKPVCIDTQELHQLRAMMQTITSQTARP